MNQLKIIARDGKFVADSREIAEMTSVRHADLLEKIDGYIVHLTNGEFRSLDFFIPATYQDSKGETRRRYDITRKGCDMVANKMTGEKGVLFTATYVTRFEEMEKALSQPMDIENLLLNPDTIIKLAQNWKEEMEKRKQLEAKVEADRPKVVFAEAVEVSQTTILVRELAVILKQNGIDIGEKRLYQELRNRGYLIKRLGSDRNMPTQKSMDLGLFEIKETPILHNSGKSTVSKTPKVTGKGQVYFVNLFKRALVRNRPIITDMYIQKSRDVSEP